MPRRWHLAAHAPTCLDLAVRLALRPCGRRPRGLSARAGEAAATPAGVTPPSTSSAAAATPSPPARALPRGAYIHLPFCVRKCLYCDFAVTALGARAAAAVAPLSPGALRGVKGGAPAPTHTPTTTTTTTPPAVASYLATLHAEIAATAGPAPGDPPLATLSFGGGTPSLIPPDDLARLVEAVDAKWGLAPGAEVSMEADPGTFDLPRLRAYLHTAGVTRVSVGVQSFEEGLLRACGRSHDAADVRAALEAVAAASPRSWSLDLMSGLPGLTAPAWAATLEAALAAQPDHISVYDLQVEAGTPFSRLYTPGVAPLPSEADAADQYEAAGAILGRGGGSGAGGGGGGGGGGPHYYQRYEVSNFARSPAHRSAHNALYWRGDADWLAFGASATSRLGGVRVARPRGVREWGAWVEGLRESGRGVPVTDFASPHGDPVPTRADLLTDIVMLRLRTADGLDVAEVEAGFGRAAADAVVRGLAPHAAAGRAAVVEGAASTWRLTDPAGFVVSNSVIADVFGALDGVGVE